MTILLITPTNTLPGETEPSLNNQSMDSQGLPAHVYMKAMQKN